MASGRWWVGALGVLLFGVAMAHDDSDSDSDSEGDGGWIRSARAKTPASPAEAARRGGSTPAGASGHPGYAKACGSCHPAYPPVLLPARSWAALMGGLAQHFGEEAEVPETERRSLEAWLLANAADRAPSRRGAWIMRSIAPETTPLRITRVPAIRKKHDEIPLRHIRDNPEVRSLGRCTACHEGAEAGVFDEDTARIPGVD